MTTITVNVAEATEEQLNYAAAQIQKLKVRWARTGNFDGSWGWMTKVLTCREFAEYHWHPAVNACQTWPLIDATKICIEYTDKSPACVRAWVCGDWLQDSLQEGPTALIAALRCFVVFNLGPRFEYPGVQS